MGAVDQNGVYKFSADDTVSTWEGLLNLGMNSVSNAVGALRQDVVYKVANGTEANIRRDALVASGLTATPENPFLFYVTGDGKFAAWDGSAWKMNGDAVSSWTTAPSGTLGNNQAGSSAILAGSEGGAERFHMEYGTSVMQMFSRNGVAAADLWLKKRYSGIATAIISNGAPESFRGVIGAHDSGYVLDNGAYTKIPLSCPGGNIGWWIRVNYIVLGWLA